MANIHRNHQDYRKYIELDPSTWVPGSTRIVQCCRRPLIYSSEEISDDPTILDGQANFIVHNNCYYVSPSETGQFRVALRSCNIQARNEDGENVTIQHCIPALYPRH